MPAAGSKKLHALTKAHDPNSQQTSRAARMKYPARSLLIAGAAMCELALSAATITPAISENIGHRRAGLWQVTLRDSNSQKPVSLKICIDQKTETALAQLASTAGSNACPVFQVRSKGNSGTIDSVCSAKTTIETAHTSFTSSQIAFHSVSRIRTSVPVGRPSFRSVVRDARWAGPCPHNMKPGEVLTSDGAKLQLSSSPADKSGTVGKAR
ncbi:MAG: DUF3617 domain-containing protein [Minisyncoccia bacterium]